MSASPKHIVIIGGGVYGAKFAEHIISQAASIPVQFTVDLIEKRDKFVYLPTALRNCVVDVTGDCVKSYDNLFSGPDRPGKGQLIRGVAVRIDEDQRVVLLENGAKIPYDVLIIATGQKWDTPLAPRNENVAEYFSSVRANVAKSKKIIILGAGSVGCELACEIKDRYGKEKRVILVQKDRLPMSAHYSERFRAKLAHIMDQLGVETKFGYKGVANTDGTVSLFKDGEPAELVQADLVYESSRYNPNSSFVPEQWINAKTGAIKVLDTFEVEAATTPVFAVGDVNSFPEVKLALHINGNTLPVLTDNVKSVLQGKQVDKIYKTKLDAIALMLGYSKATGVIKTGTFGDIVLPGWLVKRMKGQDMGGSKVDLVLGIA
ncbi:uncharacterized protein V1516DRAFT_547973 [Lipomyces oligophaga]|uniref:uncharacterized protein n=1 Tax=Lipomyces oligophaga TaxID=45792 RepID=UPI0034CF605C